MADQSAVFCRRQIRFAPIAQSDETRNARIEQTAATA
jgi:hypothetical protein